MNLGLNTSPAAVAADLELIQDLGVTHIKYGFKADTGDEDQLLREAELLTGQGFQLVIDLRDDPIMRGYDYVQIQDKYSREWIRANAERGGWTPEETRLRLAVATDPKLLKPVFRDLCEGIIEREGRDHLKHTIEGINRPSFIAQAEAMTERVGQIVARVGHLVKDWEIWGEWNCPLVAQGSFSSWDYGIHLAACYAGVKQADPSARVYTGGNGMNGSLSWLRAMLDERGGSNAWFPQSMGHLFDVCNWHPYGHTSLPEAVAMGDMWTLDVQVEAYHNMFREARRLLDEKAQGQPFASTEWGQPMSADLKPSKKASNVYTFGVWAIPEECSDEWFDESLRCFAENDFRLVCIHELRDRQSPDREAHFWGAFCGLLDLDGNKRPAFDAVQRWAWKAREGGE